MVGVVVRGCLSLERGSSSQLPPISLHSKRPERIAIFFFQCFKFAILRNDLCFDFEIFSVFLPFGPSRSKVGWFWCWSRIPKPPGPRGGERVCAPSPHERPTASLPLPVHLDNFDSAIATKSNKSINSGQAKPRLKPTRRSRKRTPSKRRSP